MQPFTSCTFVRRKRSFKLWEEKNSALLAWLRAWSLEDKWCHYYFPLCTEDKEFFHIHCEYVNRGPVLKSLINIDVQFEADWFGICCEPISILVSLFIFKVKLSRELIPFLWTWRKTKDYNLKWKVTVERKVGLIENIVRSWEIAMFRFGYFECVTSPEMVNQIAWRLVVKQEEFYDEKLQ